MKNIHVLPTGVFNQMPYQIWRNKDGGLWRPTKEFPINSNLIGKVNIYITSDKEIEWDSYWLNLDNSVISNGAMFELADKAPSCKKIIITSNPELIANGVQAIDDEFLEWFVNNPSCEFVEIEHNFIDFVMDDYKIIIPKEQQKQHLIDMMKADEELGLYDEDSPAYNHQARLVHDLGKKIKLEQESREIKLEDVFNDEKRQGVKDLIDAHKQETPEEAAERFSENHSIYDTAKDDTYYGFINGAKWQAERMYSEEEVLKFTQTILMQYKFGNTDIEQMDLLKETFQLFKKK